MAENKKTLSEEISMKGELVTSTGGGQPIKKGHKRTTEKRDPDQPRDREGHFEYNASIGKPRKYDYHGVGAKGGIAKTPATMEKFSGLGDIIKKGEKIIVGDRVWVNLAGDLTRDEFEDILKEWMPDVGYALRDENGEHALKDTLSPSQGRPSKEEKEARAAGKSHGESVGVQQSFSANTQKKMQEAMSKFGKAARDEKGNLKNMYHTATKEKVEEKVDFKNDDTDLSGDAQNMSAEEFVEKHGDKLKEFSKWVMEEDSDFTDEQEINEVVVDMLKDGTAKSMKDVFANWKD